MSLLQNKDWANASVDQRVIAKSVKRCIVGEIREWTPEGSDNGSPGKGPKEKIIINLALDEPARTTDGDDVAAGFPVVASIPVWDGREQEAMSQVKELAVACLGLERKTKEDVLARLEASGGWPGMKGKVVLVQFDVRSKDGKSFQDIRSYNRFVPEGAPAS